MHDRPGIDDPLWDYVLIERLKPYIPYVRKWWDKLENFTTHDVGIYEIPTDGKLLGLKVRFTRTAIRSPIKGVQAFPFIPTIYLQISGVQGGANKMIERVCGKGLEIEEFTIIEKHNLPSTLQQGQFIAFVPTEILSNTKKLGVWLYFTKEEIDLIARGETNKAIKQKALLKI